MRCVLEKTATRFDGFFAGGSPIGFCRFLGGSMGGFLGFGGSLFSMSLPISLTFFSSFPARYGSPDGLSSHHSYLSKRINCSSPPQYLLAEPVFGRNRPFRSATLGRAIPVQSRRCNRQLEHGRPADIALRRAASVPVISGRVRSSKISLGFALMVLCSLPHRSLPQKPCNHVVRVLLRESAADANYPQQ